MMYELIISNLITACLVGWLYYQVNKLNKIIRKYQFIENFISEYLKCLYKIALPLILQLYGAGTLNNINSMLSNMNFFHNINPTSNMVPPSNIFETFKPKSTEGKPEEKQEETETTEPPPKNTSFTNIHVNI